MKGLLKERILDAMIEFILREALNIAEKDFYELIINVIKRKKQMIAEIMMARILDTLMTKEEKKEIREVFAFICDNVDNDDQSKKKEFIFDKIQNIKIEVIEKVLYDEIENKVVQILLCDGVANIKIGANVSNNNKKKRLQWRLKCHNVKLISYRGVIVKLWQLILIYCQQELLQRYI